jgi:hypothetical protein
MGPTTPSDTPDTQRPPAVPLSEREDAPMSDDLGPHAQSDEILGRFYCVHCGNDWPCRVAVLASKIEQVAGEGQRLLMDVSAAASASMEHGDALRDQVAATCLRGVARLARHVHD